MARMANMCVKTSCPLMLVVAFLMLTRSTPLLAIEEFEDAAETDPKNSLTWGIFTQEFRREHNFAFSAGSMVSHWEIENLGAKGSYLGNRGAVYSQFQYAFHLPFYRKTGFILGSSIGYSRTTREFEDGFAPPEDFAFPGILTGVVYNANPRSRGGITLDYHLERWNALRTQVEDGPQTSVHVTVEIMDLEPFVDFFFDLNWAVRLEGHIRRAFYHRPRSPEGTALDFSVARRDVGAGVGLVYHLL